MVNNENKLDETIEFIQQNTEVFTTTIIEETPAPQQSKEPMLLLKNKTYYTKDNIFDNLNNTEKEKIKAKGIIGLTLENLSERRVYFAIIEKFSKEYFEFKKDPKRPITFTPKEFYDACGIKADDKKARKRVINALNILSRRTVEMCFENKETKKFYTIEQHFCYTRFLNQFETEFEYLSEQAKKDKTNYIKAIVIEGIGYFLADPRFCLYKPQEMKRLFTKYAQAPQGLWLALDYFRFLANNKNFDISIYKDSLIEKLKLQKYVKENRHKLLDETIQKILQILKQEGYIFFYKIEKGKESKTRGDLFKITLNPEQYPIFSSTELTPESS